MALTRAQVEAELIQERYAKKAAVKAIREIAIAERNHKIEAATAALDQWIAQINSLRGSIREKDGLMCRLKATEKLPDISTLRSIRETNVLYLETYIQFHAFNEKVSQDKPHCSKNARGEAFLLRGKTSAMIERMQRDIASLNRQIQDKETYSAQKYSDFLQEYEILQRQLQDLEATRPKIPTKLDFSEQYRVIHECRCDAQSYVRYGCRCGEIQLQREYERKIKMQRKQQRDQQRQAEMVREINRRMTQSPLQRS